MTYEIALFAFLFVIVVLLFIFYIRKNFEFKKLKQAKEDEIKDIFKERWNKEEQHLNNLQQVKERALEEKYNEKIKFANETYELTVDGLKKKLESVEFVLKEKEKRYEEVNQDLNLYKEGKIKEIDGAAAEYEQRKRLENVKAIEEHNNSMKKASAELQEQLKRSEDVLRNQIEEIKAELEEERRKREAVNEEILRQRALEEEQDFYRIQLDPNDKDDVEILRNIAPRLRHPEAINKVIWSGYYQKPLAELRKRVAVEGPGVYKITRIKTNEIYIGQAVNVSTRWAEHCKAALGVGTLASSQLHRTMAQDGCENFIFELLEEVPKDKLRERESYYIDFYDSKNYGLNTVSGDKNK